MLNAVATAERLAPVSDGMGGTAATGTTIIITTATITLVRPVVFA